MNFPNFNFQPSMSSSDSIKTGNAGVLFGTPAVQASVRQITSVSNLPSSLGTGYSLDIHSHGLGVNYSNIKSNNQKVETVAVNMNLYNSNKMAVNANAFRNEITLKGQNNYKVHQNVFGLDVKHNSGHSVGDSAATDGNLMIIKLLWILLVSLYDMLAEYFIIKIVQKQK